MEEFKQDLLTVSEVKKILRIPLSTLYYLTKIGAVKSFRIGKHIRYGKSDINYYLENRFGKQTLHEIDNPRERRKYPRINCVLNCRFKIDLPEKKLTDLDGNIKNISAGGLFMDAGQGYDTKNDDPVEIEFNLAKENLIVTGRIVRVKDNGFAVKYRNISEDAKEKIIRYVG